MAGDNTMPETESEHEVWRPIPEWEDRYEVSNLGRVRSLKRKGRRSTMILKLSVNKAGYCSVTLHRDSTGSNHQIHRLVYAAFVSPIPETLGVSHIDGDKTNNRVDNLQTTTAAVRGLARFNGPGKWSEYEELRNKGETYRAIGEHFGVTPQAVQQALARAAERKRKLSQKPNSTAKRPQ